MVVFFPREKGNCSMTFRDSWGCFIDTVIFYRCVHDCVHGFMYPGLRADSCACGGQRSRLVFFTLLTDWLTDSLDRISQWTWSSLFQQDPGNCLSETPRAGIIDRYSCASVTVISFYPSAGDTNSGLHACRAITFFTEPPSQSLNYSYWLYEYLTRVVQSSFKSTIFFFFFWFCLLTAGIISTHHSTQLKIIYYCVYVHLWACVHYGPCVEVRIQLCGVSSLLPPLCGFWALNLH